MVVLLLANHFIPINNQIHQSIIIHISSPLVTMLTIMLQGLGLFQMPQISQAMVPRSLWGHLFKVCRVRLCIEFLSTQMYPIRMRLAATRTNEARQERQRKRWVNRQQMINGKINRTQSFKRHRQVCHRIDKGSRLSWRRRSLMGIFCNMLA